MIPGLVSVIINCRNGEAYLRETLDCVVEQSYSQWEVIFWDNQSTDRSGAILQEYATTDSRFRYFWASSFSPLGQARNLAIEHASGEYIAFLDSDDLWAPEKLERQVGLFQNPSVNLVYSDVISFNEGGQSHRLGLRKKFYRGKCFDRLLADNFLVLSAVVVRRRALTDLSLMFDPNFHIIEEYEVFLLLSYHGEIDYSDEVLAKWRVHARSDSWTRFSEMAEETERLMTKLLALDSRIPILHPVDWNRRLDWIVRRKALGYWINGQGARCREIIRHAGRFSADLVSLFVLSFFPSRMLIRWVYRLRGNSVFPKS